MNEMTSTPAVPQRSKERESPTGTPVDPKPIGFSGTWAGRFMRVWRALGYDTATKAVTVGRDQILTEKLYLSKSAIQIRHGRLGQWKCVRVRRG